MGNIIHMETETVRDLSRKGRVSFQDLDQSLSDVHSQLNSLVWSGPSRDELLIHYESLRTQSHRLMEEAQRLFFALAAEVDQWQETDAHFGAGGSRTEVPNRGNDGSLWGNLKEFINPKPLQDLIDDLVNTPAGQDLIEDAKRAGIAIRFPDGTILGDPNGEIIDVAYGKTGAGVLGYQSGQEIVINDDWLHRHSSSPDDLNSVIGHEIQHAIDMKEGFKDRTYYQGIEDCLDDPRELEEYLSRQTADRVASETRAWERGEAISEGRAFEDDGVTSGQEARDILYQKGYVNNYLKELDNIPGLKDKYEVEYYVDQYNQVRARVTPKPQVADLGSSSW